MKFFRRASGNPFRLGIFPGTFNPITVAHLALAHAALSSVDEVVFVLPRTFPHKTYSGGSFDERVRLLNSALKAQTRFSVALSEGGLFVEISAECREMYGPEVRQSFLCGRDAAERVANWDYGRPEALTEILKQFDLLVAARRGEYSPPPHLTGSFASLDLEGEYDHVSASEVRDRLAKGEAWEHLVPPSICNLVREIYTPGRK